MSQIGSSKFFHLGPPILYNKNNNLLNFYSLFIFEIPPNFHFGYKKGTIENRKGETVWQQLLRQTPADGAIGSTQLTGDRLH